jgi:hypothetical protein
MNEQRIRELAKQATAFSDQIADQTPYFRDIDEDGLTWEGKLNWARDQKFAELIAKECATICKDTAEKQFSPLFSRESDGAEVCYKKIKQHFGVEE